MAYIRNGKVVPSRGFINTLWLWLTTALAMVVLLYVVYCHDAAFIIIIIVFDHTLNQLIDLLPPQLLQ